MLGRERLFELPVLLLAGGLARLLPVVAVLELAAAGAGLGEGGLEGRGLRVAERQDLRVGRDVAGDLGLAALLALGGHQRVELGLLLGAEDAEDAVLGLVLGGAHRAAEGL